MMTSTSSARVSIFCVTFVSPDSGFVSTTDTVVFSTLGYATPSFVSTLFSSSHSSTSIRVSSVTKLLLATVDVSFKDSKMFCAVCAASLHKAGTSPMFSARLFLVMLASAIAVVCATMFAYLFVLTRSLSSLSSLVSVGHATDTPPVLPCLFQIWGASDNVDWCGNISSTFFVFHGEFPFSWILYHLTNVFGDENGLCYKTR